MSTKRKKSFDEDSIDLVNLLSKLWKRKSFILKITLSFTFIGIFYSLSLDNIYKASSIFYPHFEKNSLSQGQGLKSLAGLAGINISNEVSDNIPPTLYPNIINSPLYKTKLLDGIININGNNLSLRDYLIRKSKNKFSLKKLLNKPFNFFSNFFSKNNQRKEIENINILRLSQEEFNLHNYLSEIIILQINEKEGFINLSVKETNPIIASQIAKSANELLQNSIIEFKLKNIKDTYNFVVSQLNIAKNNFYLLQDSLAVFNDKNINIKTDLYRNQFSRIESEYLISKNIYNELALNKEKTAIEVKKNTPIFTIIKPVVIPNEKSEPKRSLIVIIFTFLGFIIGSVFILIKPIFKETLKIIIKN
tara:strand:+ start:660 stop:1748 length:1089 start_codon:yes stop_codon:yes gene_type:complete